jgi:stage II sporulation protein D
VLLGSATRDVSVQVQEGWRLLDAHDAVIWPDARAGNVAIERQGQRIRARQSGGGITPWHEGHMTIEPLLIDDVLAWGGRSYRGAILLVPTDSAILVINRLDVEDYLRGVVPLEVGAMTTEEHAAVEAQAVAARSFTYPRMMAATVERAWDLTAQESDQVYGGVGVETFLGDLAVSATAGWVLSAAGRVVFAPYHAICGGRTAPPSEVWRGGIDDFLRPVADDGPAPGRSWCDIAPRFAWERRISVEALASAMARYGVAYGAAGGVREVRGLRAGSATATGRVGTVDVETDRGTVSFRGNDIRFVLRPDGVEVLPSTRFTIAEERGPDGTLRAWLLTGQGHGHGVGMCQWGAIGRARAGHDFRAILKAYYPGAELTRAP